MSNSLRAGFDAEESLNRDKELRAAMRKLAGQISTPSYLRHRAQTLQDEGLMRFHEWPAGHWGMTDKGRAFLADEPAP